MGGAKRGGIEKKKPGGVKDRDHTKGEKKKEKIKDNGTAQVIETQCSWKVTGALSSVREEGCEREARRGEKLCAAIPLLAGNEGESGSEMRCRSGRTGEYQRKPGKVRWYQ